MLVRSPGHPITRPVSDIRTCQVIQDSDNVLVSRTALFSWGYRAILSQDAGKLSDAVTEDAASLFVWLVK